MSPKISIVLPTYNQSDYLSQCIQSVLDQEMEDFELIIVNDGSTDDTQHILSTIDDPRVKVIHQENKKLPGALNTGFKQAKGEYLTWISSDCYCDPNFLETLSKTLHANPDVGIVYSNYKSIDVDGNFLKLEEMPHVIGLKEILKSCCIGASFMYRRACMRKIGSYNCELVGSEDWDYWVRMISHFKSMHINEAPYSYRWHAESMTSNIEPYIKITVQHEKNMKDVGIEKYNRADLPEIFYFMGYAYRHTKKLKSAIYYLTALKYRLNVKYVKALIKLMIVRRICH